MLIPITKPPYRHSVSKRLGLSESDLVENCCGLVSWIVLEHAACVGDAAEASSTVAPAELERLA